MTRQIEIDRWRSPTSIDIVIRSAADDDAALEVEFLRRLSPQTLYEAGVQRAARDRAAGCGAA